MTLPQLAPSLGFTTSRLAVIGTGALGSEVCRLLLAQRYKHLLLIDPDLLEPRNLPLSPLFRLLPSSQLGRAKVEVLRDLAFAQPFALAWQAERHEIADLGLARFKDIDLLISCTDSVLARVETAFVAQSLGLPMLDAGVHANGVSGGRVTWFAPSREAACALCGLSEARRAEVLAFALSPSLGCTAPPEARSIPMTGSPAAVESTARELIDWLPRLNLLPPRTSITRQLGGGSPPLSSLIELTRSESCPWHQLPSPGSLCALPPDRPIRDLLAPGEILELPWPICLQARCTRCGHRVRPLRRTAFVRRSLPCPACAGFAPLEPLESIQSIAATQSVARNTLQELGLPPANLYHRRRAILPDSPASRADRP